MMFRMRLFSWAIVGWAMLQVGSLAQEVNCNINKPPQHHLSVKIQKAAAEYEIELDAFAYFTIKRFGHSCSLEGDLAIDSSTESWKKILYSDKELRKGKLTPIIFKVNDLAGYVHKDDKGVYISFEKSILKYNDIRLKIEKLRLYLCDNELSQDMRAWLSAYANMSRYPARRDYQKCRKIGNTLAKLEKEKGRQIIFR